MIGSKVGSPSDNTPVRSYGSPAVCPFVEDFKESYHPHAYIPYLAILALAKYAQLGIQVADLKAANIGIEVSASGSLRNFIPLGFLSTCGRCKVAQIKEPGILQQVDVRGASRGVPLYPPPLREP